MSMTAGWDETEFEAIFREHYQRVVRITGSDELTYDGALEFLAARLVVKYTQADGRVSGLELIRRPVQKLCEMEKKRSLDLVLIGRGMGACGPRHS
jgi:hypothetical protein